MHTHNIHEANTNPHEAKWTTRVRLSALRRPPSPRQQATRWQPHRGKILLEAAPKNFCLFLGAPWTGWRARDISAALLCEEGLCLGTYAPTDICTQVATFCFSSSGRIADLQPRCSLSSGCGSSSGWRTPRLPMERRGPGRRTGARAASCFEVALCGVGLKLRGNPTPLPLCNFRVWEVDTSLEAL